MLPNGFNIRTINVTTSTIYICTYADFKPEDYYSYLTSNEIERLSCFKHPKRRMEFTATRILRHTIFGYSHIHYDEHGAPYIEDEGYISISHSKNTVAIAINPEFKIGLDLEEPREMIHSLKHKFLNNNEIETWDCSDYVNVTKIWSAKEALYKLAGRKQIIFKDELLLRLEKSHWHGTIINPDHILEVKLNIFGDENLIISINTQAVEEHPRNI